MPESKRLYFLDNLRGFIVLMVIVLHAVLSYSPYPPEWWYVLDAQTHPFFLKASLLIDVPIMPMMFFIAGFFALPSLWKRGGKAFLREKFRRIGLPWIFGVLILTPPTAYLIPYTRRVAPNLGRFWLRNFWTLWYQQSVYWYLGILFALFAGLVLISKKDVNLRRLPASPVKPKAGIFLEFIALSALFYWMIGLVYHPDGWLNGLYILYFQPVRLPLYIGAFMLGGHAWRMGWFREGGYMPEVGGWGFASVVSGFLYLTVRLTPAEVSGVPIIVGLAIWGIFFNIFCLTTMMALLGIFGRHINGNGRFWSSIAANSYGMYYFHPLFLYPLALLFTGITMPLLLKVIIVTGGGALLTWVFVNGIVKQIPGLKDIF